MQNEREDKKKIVLKKYKRFIKGEIYMSYENERSFYKGISYKSDLSESPLKPKNNGHPEDSAIKAQQVINNLVRAAENDAIVARYEEGKYIVYPGPLVNKDRLPELLDTYIESIVGTGTSKHTIKKQVKRIEEGFFAGTPRDQEKVLKSLEDATKDFK